MQAPLRSAHKDDPKTHERPAFQNPYEGHRGLTANEQLVLGEYARLAATVRRVAVLSTQLSSSSLHTNVLNELRAIERKMGLVLTLFKASVWAIVMQQSDVQDEADELEYVDMPHDVVEEEPEDDAWDTTSTDAPDARRPTW